MAKPELNSKTSTKVEDNSSLKGTLVSVLLLGLFIVIVWASVYTLYVDRF